MKDPKNLKVHKLHRIKPMEIDNNRCTTKIFRKLNKCMSKWIPTFAHGACIRDMCLLLCELPLGWISISCVQRWIQKLVQSCFLVIPEKTTAWLNIVNGGTCEEMTTIRTIIKKQKEERKLSLCSSQDFHSFPSTILVGCILRCSIPSLSFFKAHTLNHTFECQCVS